MTNPYASYTPLDLIPLLPEGAAGLSLAGLAEAFIAQAPAPFVCTGQSLALFPASRSKETDLHKATFCGGSVPEGADLMQLFIDAIRDGQVNPEPDARSGWYDYQLHALETLLLPERAVESDHLLLTAAYKKKLVETFKSILTQNRETHVKQLEMGGDTSAGPTEEVDLYPLFPVEPFPTFYLRSGRAYRFLKTFLLGTLGQEVLQGQRRLHSDGTRAELDLLAELDRMTELLYGLTLLAGRSVGVAPTALFLEEELAELSEEACIARARTWLQGWQTDPDVMADPRVLVPVWDNALRSEVIYWAILGVKVLKVSAQFVEGYEPRVLGAVEGNCQVKDIVPHSYYLLVEQMEQVVLPRQLPPPTREEYRAICDQHDSAEALIQALEGWDA